MRGGGRGRLAMVLDTLGSSVPIKIKHFLGPSGLIGARQDGIDEDKDRG
jgi:hypothetical protein